MLPVKSRKRFHSKYAKFSGWIEIPLKLWRQFKINLFLLDHRRGSKIEIKSADLLYSTRLSLSPESRFFSFSTTIIRTCEKWQNPSATLKYRLRSTHRVWFAAHVVSIDGDDRPRIFFNQTAIFGKLDASKDAFLNNFQVIVACRLWKYFFWDFFFL